MRLLRPIIVSRSLTVSPRCSITNLMASTGSGMSIGKCLRSYASTRVTRTSSRSPSGVLARAFIKDSICLSAARWSAFVLTGLIFMLLAPSNLLCVDPVILSVGADEADVHHAIGVVDPHHQPVLVARDVEHRPSVPEDAGADFGPRNAGTVGKE